MKEYIPNFEFLKDNEGVTAQFFKYLYNLGKNKGNYSGNEAKAAEEAENLFYDNILGTICFFTPEIGRWSTVGGLGVMVDELSQGLANLGLKVIVISPYYNENKKGQTDYLSNDPFNIHYIRNVSIELDQNFTFGVHSGEGNGIQYYFLHNSAIFPKPYPNYGSVHTVKEIACFAKAALQLLCDLTTIPSLIVTNDWFTGLAPAYGKNGAFGDTFKETKFFHICHNLEISYEGRVFPSEGEGTLEGIYKLNPEWLIDPTWKQRVINPSRCALMMSDQWGTVSSTYKEDIKKNSPLSFFLNKKTEAFSHSNGILKEKRLKELKEKCPGGREEAKKYIQQTYFGYKEADYSVPIFSFVGRLCEQKGVLLILDSVEELVMKTNHKINILIGGMGDMNDPYLQKCIEKIDNLRGKYPHAFWANPKEFFYDGPKINVGSDFGLMPSLYEPGGIVQHEFFVAGTPVLCFKTGGLKDTVIEFNSGNNTGNGITFESYDREDFIKAVMRALDLFNNKEKYNVCQKNAFDSVIDVSNVCKAWCKEFYRLFGKIYFDIKEARSELRQIDSSNSPNSSNSEEFYAYIHRDDVKSDDEVPVSFSYQNLGNNPNEVYVCTSFDNWETKHKLNFDPCGKKWYVTINLQKGRTLYKYIIDGNWVYNPRGETCTEEDGTVNNVLVI